MSRQYELAVLASLLLDETGEYISAGDIDPEIFQYGLKDTAVKLIQYKKDGGVFDPLLLHKLVDDMSVYKELIESTGKVVVFNAQQYLQELKYGQFEKRFYEKLNRGERPTPEDLRHGIELLQNKKTDSELYDFKKPVSQFIDDLYKDELEHYETGIPTIDKMLGRIIPDDGEMISIGGATGLGKSNLAFRFLANFILKDVPCLYMSCEMGFNSIYGHILCQNSFNISYKRWRNKQLTEQEKLEMKHISEKFYGKKSLINVSNRFDMNEIKKLIENTGSKIIFIDFVQNFKLELARGHTPASANSELAKAVKDIAMDKKVIVFCISQLNDLGKLRESASWEDKSDVVCKMFLMKKRQGVGKDAVETPCVNEQVKGIDFVIQKNRHGDEGKIEMILNRTTTNIAPGEGIWE